MTSARACVLAAMTLALLAACKKDRPAAVDSVAADSVSVSVPAAPVNPGWQTDATGPAMLLAMTDNSAGALVVLPLMTDSAVAESGAPSLDSMANLEVELFGRGGFAGSTALVVGQEQQSSEGCVWWPQARLAETPPKPWRIGFVRGTAVPLALDSLESMNAQDSAGVTREIARLSSIVAEGDDPAFGGLPFSVRRAYRFQLSGSTAILADVVRKISEEANPRQEHLLLLAERPASGGQYSAMFDNRVAGSEETVQTNELLAAVRLVKGGRPTLVISFEYENGGRVALLQRLSDRQWRVTWRSAYTGC